MRTIIISMTLVVAGCLGCNENVDPATPDGALHLFRNALVANDVPQMLAQTSAKTRTTLTAILKHAKKQYATIKRSYPPEYAMGAWGAYPPGVISATTLDALFEAFIKERFEALKRGPGLTYGLSASGAPVVLGSTATVATKSGESVPFVLEEGRWRTTVFEATLLRNLERIGLNQRTLQENIAALKTYSKKGAPAAPKAKDR